MKKMYENEMLKERRRSGWRRLVRMKNVGDNFLSTLCKSEPAEEEDGEKKEEEKH
jgi:hypothetical protein